jgi:DnaJ-class molecular chaperone
MTENSYNPATYGFLCPRCGGTHWGRVIERGDDGQPVLLDEARCHDEFGRGCKRHGPFVEPPRHHQQCPRCLGTRRADGRLCAECKGIGTVIVRKATNMSDEPRAIALARELMSALGEPVEVIIENTDPPRLLVLRQDRGIVGSVVREDWTARETDNVTT